PGERQVELQQRRGRDGHGRLHHGHRPGHCTRDREGGLEAEDGDEEGRQAEGRLAPEAEGDRLGKKARKRETGRPGGAAPSVCAETTLRARQPKGLRRLALRFGQSNDSLLSFSWGSTKRERESD